MMTPFYWNRIRESKRIVCIADGLSFDNPWRRACFALARMNRFLAKNHRFYVTDQSTETEVQEALKLSLLKVGLLTRQHGCSIHYENGCLYVGKKEHISQLLSIQSPNKKDEES